MERSGSTCFTFCVIYDSFSIQYRCKMTFIIKEVLTPRTSFISKFYLLLSNLESSMAFTSRMKRVPHRVLSTSHLPTTHLFTLTSHRHPPLPGRLGTLPLSGTNDTTNGYRKPSRVISPTDLFVKRKVSSFWQMVLTRVGESRST